MSRGKSKKRSRRKAPEGSGPSLEIGLALVLCAFIGAGLLLYDPALSGDFISDDQHYVKDNPYVHDMSADSVLEILNPRGGVVMMVENYAPVHLLVHGLSWQLFGERVYGHHVLNVVLHGLASVLLIVFFERTGLPRPAALFGALIFLVHPGNVEAVAWISQLKSSLAMVLALCALLLQRGRPLLGASLFGLALLAKPSALFALPVAIMLQWLGSSSHEQSGEDERSADSRNAWGGVRSAWLWLGLWALIFVAFYGVEMTAFHGTAGQVPSLYADEDSLTRFRSHVAIGMRYLVLAATSYGLSTFHEPLAAGWLDPWWLCGALALGLMGWRTLVVLRARRVEAVYWAWAAASFAPVSGVLELPYPMADRYLYSMLPGLIGIAVLAGSDALRISNTAQWRAAWLPGVVTGLAVCLVLGFSLRTYDRAALWMSNTRVMADAVGHYPNGTAAQLRKADQAAMLEDADGVIEALRAANRRGYERLDHLLQRPNYAFVREDPRFRALVEEIAATMIRRIEEAERPTQVGLHAQGVAYQILGDTAAAIRSMELALEIPGPRTAQVRADLVQLRAVLRRESLPRRR